MTNDVTKDSAMSGAQPPQTPAPLPQGAEVAPTAVPAQPGFTAEQQAAVDRLVSERLKRDRAKWQQEAEAEAKAKAEAAEAERQQALGEWEVLARKHEATAAELKAKLAQMEHDQLRRDAAQAAGIPQLWQRLQGETAEALAEDAAALAAMMQPTQPVSGQPVRPATLPTPPAQGRNGLTDEERRQRAARTF